MIEPNIMAVDASGRVMIPTSICEKLDWVNGQEPIAVWLLTEAFGRCRIVRRGDIDSDGELAQLLTLISLPKDEDALTAPMEFASTAEVVLRTRLLETRIIAVGRSWRVRLPNVLVKLWDLTPGQDKVSVLLRSGYIEVWAMDTLRSAYRTPLTNLL